MTPFAASLSSVGMSMRPPYGDHAARPVSSYRMNRKLGAPSGAFLGANGVQSGFESRTSSFMTPLKPGAEGASDDGFAAGGGAGACFGVSCRLQPAEPTANPIATHTDSARLQRFMTSPLAPNGRIEVPAPITPVGRVPCIPTLGRSERSHGHLRSERACRSTGRPDEADRTRARRVYAYARTSRLAKPARS